MMGKINNPNSELHSSAKRIGELLAAELAKDPKNELGEN